MPAALTLTTLDLDGLRLLDRPNLVPEANEIAVDLRASALNRRDLRVTAGLWPGVTAPIVPGSDGAGVVNAIGGSASGIAVGDEVIVLPSLGWGDNPRVQADRYTILGGPTDGTFAAQVCVPASNVFPKPKRLSFEEAAALPLAGVTVWRALFSRGELRSGETVLVTGAGAGTSTLAVQLATAAGARVYVTSSSTQKIAQSIEIGAVAGFDYRADGWEAEFVSRTGGADLVIDSAGTLAASIACCRKGARIVNFGATVGPLAEFAYRDFYMNQLSLHGSLMGNPGEFRELLRATESQSWRPVIDSVRPLAEGRAALERMRDGLHFGKLVLTP